jgi:hypothetical protein
MVCYGFLRFVRVKVKVRGRAVKSSRLSICRAGR